MKTKTLVIISLLYLIMASAPALAAAEKMNHSAHPATAAEKMDHSAHPATAAEKMDHSAHVGQKIHESTVEGYRLAYHLLDLPNRKEHHLMVYILDPAGKAVTTAQVGYLVIGPDKTKQKAMAMGMKDAFGADVNLTVPGAYTVKVKAVAGEKKLLDEFTHEVK